MLAVLFCIDCDSCLFLTSYSGLHSYCWTKSTLTDLYVCIILSYFQMSVFNLFFSLLGYFIQVFLEVKNETKKCLYKVSIIYISLKFPNIQFTCCILHIMFWPKPKSGLCLPCKHQNNRRTTLLFLYKYSIWTKLTPVLWCSEARKSLNRPPAGRVLDNLIYNYSPTYCGKAG